MNRFIELNYFGYYAKTIPIIIKLNQTILKLKKYML